MKINRLTALMFISFFALTSTSTHYSHQLTEKESPFADQIQKNSNILIYYYNLLLLL